ncbi:MAG TPA: M56 family metallopeptidase [Blastocatellia bacterium]|nr:M56 family metallopeptidase [Blastocatellia bacterium]
MSLTTLLSSASIYDQSPVWLSFFADAAIKGIILLATAGLLVAIFRRSAAAVRHLIWSLALASFLILPVVSFVAPKWNVGLFPAINDTPDSSGSAIAKKQTMPVPLIQDSPATQDSGNTQTLPAAGSDMNHGSAAGTSTFGAIANWPLRILAIWFAGALIVLARLLLGTINIRRIVKSAAPMTESKWIAQAQALCWRLKISNPIPLYKTDKLQMPLTSGAFKSVVLVPSDIEDWPSDRQQVVLLHELAHVKRKDCLTQLLAQIVCAVYWFNPLVWFAARQLRIERERACDDYVLDVGTLASDYATHLLEIARTMGAAKCPSLAAVAIAKRSQLEGRLLAILDPNLNRKGLNSRSTALLVAVLAVMIMPLAAIQPFARAATKDQQTVISTRQSSVAEQRASQIESSTSVEAKVNSNTQVASNTVVNTQIESTTQVAPTPQPSDNGTQQDAAPRPMPMPMPMPTPMPMPMPSPSPTGGEFRHGDHDRDQSAQSESDGKVIDALVAALKDPNKEVRHQALWALGQRGDKRAVEGIIGALSDEDSSVRQQAAWALGQIDDRRAVAPLMSALKDSNESVRQQAAWALGQLDDKSAVDALVGALSDQSAGIRSQAAWALGQLDDARAVPGLINALTKDQSEGVRSQAIWALGQIEDKRSVDGLITALKDSSPKIRSMAAWSLGQIGDSRAADALIAALKDTDAHVRQQAAWALAQLNSH